ncbi:MAG: hypothetical protein WA080_10670 [Sulfuricurvum sp.]
MLLSSKNVVLLTLCSALLVGCSGKKIEINEDFLQKNSTSSAESPFRQSLIVLGKIHHELAKEIPYDNSIVLEGVDSKICQATNQTITGEWCKPTNDPTKFTVYSPVRYFSVATITNKSADPKLQGLDLSNYVKTALANVGEDYKVLDADNRNQNLPTSYHIAGAITGFETTYKKGDNKRISAYGGQGRGEFDVNADSRNGEEYTEITLDLFISKNKGDGWRILPKTTSSTKLILQKNNATGGFSLSILGTGFSFSQDVEAGNNLAYATRLLVEKSLVELLTKLDDLPYAGFEPDGGLKEKDQVSFLYKKGTNDKPYRIDHGVVSKIDDNGMVTIHYSRVGNYNDKTNKEDILSYTASLDELQLKRSLSKNQTWDKALKQKYDSKAPEHRVKMAKAFLQAGHFSTPKWEKRLTEKGVNASELIDIMEQVPLQILTRTGATK